MIDLNLLKRKIKSFDKKKSKFWKNLYQLLLQIYLSFKFLTNRKFRSEKITIRRYKNYVHQKSSFTKENRYPQLFQICKEYFKSKTNPAILSFGCSTGEEVNSLRDYLPNVQIFGVDINYYCLRRCRKKQKHNKDFFYHFLSKEFNNLKNLDAIFCLAVFQHPDNRHVQSIQHTTLYKFNMFENQLYDLNMKLKTGGLLFIDNCDFNFLETSVSKEYTTLEVANNQILRLRPLFNKKNEKISTKSNSYRVFKKIC